MNSKQGPDEQVGMDFRSARFRDQAHALARMTGCPLVLCRQELFIAEGDAVEAYLALTQHTGAGLMAKGMH